MVNLEVLNVGHFLNLFQLLVDQTRLFDFIQILYKARDSSKGFISKLIPYLSHILSEILI